ncbi:MAG: bifunctional nuclease family protein [bacterium]
MRKISIFPICIVFLLAMALVASGQDETERLGITKIEVHVGRLVIDPVTDTPVVILFDLPEERFLPIWVDKNVAAAIALGMEGRKMPRPMTHDLIKNIVDGLRVRVEHVLITGMKGSTYYAAIFLLSPDGSEVSVDSRPSDAIAVAIRMGAPIFVEKKLMDSMSIKVEPEATPPSPNIQL